MLRVLASSLLLLVAASCDAVRGPASSCDGGAACDADGGDGADSGGPDVDGGHTGPSVLENHLRLCEYAPAELAFSHFFTDVGTIFGCYVTGTATPCTLDQANLPTNAEYQVRATSGLISTLTWADGSELVKAYSVGCQNVPGSGHKLVSAPTRGQYTNVGLEYTLASLDGGAAGSKPVVVSAKVAIALSPGKVAKTNDLRLSVQYLLAGVWTNAASTLFSTTTSVQTFEVNAEVPAWKKIRFVVTGQQSASESGSTTYAVSSVGLTVTE